MTRDEAAAVVEERIHAADAGQAPEQEDPRPFWLRLLSSVRVKVLGGTKPDGLEITGGTKF